LGLDYQPFPFHHQSQYGTLLLWETPGIVAPELVWQMPHVIWLAELQRQVANHSQGVEAAQQVVNFHAELAEQTARFLASFVYYNTTTYSFYMGPPLLGGEEEGKMLQVVNPTFELIYFALALDIANDFREWRRGCREIKHGNT